MILRNNFALIILMLLVKNLTRKVGQVLCDTELLEASEKISVATNRVLAGTVESDITHCSPAHFSLAVPSDLFGMNISAASSLPSEVYSYQGFIAAARGPEVVILGVLISPKQYRIYRRNRGR